MSSALPVLNIAQGLIFSLLVSSTASHPAYLNVKGQCESMDQQLSTKITWKQREQDEQTMIFRKRKEPAPLPPCTQFRFLLPFKGRHSPSEIVFGDEITFPQLEITDPQSDGVQNEVADEVGYSGRQSGCLHSACFMREFQKGSEKSVRV